MKKFLMGAMVLLATVSAFTSCNKKDKDSSSEEITISATEISLAPGDERRLTVKPSDVKVTWSSSNEDVATVSKVGNVTAVNYGEATIYATTESKTLECKVNVVNALELVNFTQASVSFSYDKTTKKPVLSEIHSDTIPVATITSTGAKVYGIIISATINLFSEGLGYDDNGSLSGADKGYILVAPGYICYADYDMNPDAYYLDKNGQKAPLFEKGQHITWSTGIWQTADTIDANILKAGVFTNETKYMEDMKAAIEAYNKQDYKTMSEYWIDADTTCFSGAQLYYYVYDEEIEDYTNYSWYFPEALATKVIANLEYNDASMYMYAINGYRIALKPLHKAELGGIQFSLGIEVQTDGVTGDATITNKKVVFDKVIEKYVPVEESEDVAIRGYNNGLMQLDEATIKALKAKQNAPMMPVVRRK